MTDQEKIEMLMQPRVIIDMDWPGNKMPVGTILIMTGHNCYVGYGMIYHESMVHKHPHLFRRLEWWERRKPGEMPEYVKVGNNGKPRKVKRIFRDCFIEFEGGRIRTLNSKFIPVTTSEFQSFNQIK